MTGPRSLCLTAMTVHSQDKYLTNETSDYSSAQVLPVVQRHPDRPLTVKGLHQGA